MKMKEEKKKFFFFHSISAQLCWTIQLQFITVYTFQMMNRNNRMWTGHKICQINVKFHQEREETLQG